VSDSKDSPIKPEKRVYCTYFDVRYLIRGLAMIQSLRAIGETDEVEVLCLDEESRSLIKRSGCSGIKTTALQELVSTSAELQRVQKDRSSLEFIWTLTPFWIEYLFARRDVNRVIYLDADLYFFGSLRPLHLEYEDSAVAIIPHRFHDRVAERESRSGKYNVGLLAFRRSDDASRILKYWMSCCISSCSATPDGRVFGDQKYLDDWPTRFNGVKVLDNIGANVAPWNLLNYRVTERGGKPYVDSEPVIFYHYHGLAVFNGSLAHTGFRLRSPDVQLLYRPYLLSLSAIYWNIRPVAIGLDLGVGLPPLGKLIRWLYHRQLTFIRY
jgi:hypothetical protein